VNVQVIMVEQFNEYTRGLAMVDGIAKAFSFKAPLDHSKLTPLDLGVLAAVARHAIHGRAKP